MIHILCMVIYQATFLTIDHYCILQTLSSVFLLFGSCPVNVSQNSSHPGIHLKEKNRGKGIQASTKILLSLYPS